MNSRNSSLPNTVGELLQGNAPSESKAGLNWNAIAGASSCCLSGMYAGLLALALMVASYFLPAYRVRIQFVGFGLFSLANGYHTWGLFQLRAIDSMFCKLPYFFIAWYAFIIGIAICLGYCAFHFANELPNEPLPMPFYFVTGLLSTVSHLALLSGMRCIPYAGDDRQFRWCAGLALYCCMLFYGSLTILSGAAIYQPWREWLMELTEGRTLTIVMGCILFAIALSGVLAYLRTLYFLRSQSNIARLMFHQIDPYRL